MRDERCRRDHDSAAQHDERIDRLAKGDDAKQRRPYQLQNSDRLGHRQRRRAKGACHRVVPDRGEHRGHGQPEQFVRTRRCPVRNRPGQQHERAQDRQHDDDDNRILDRRQPFGEQKRCREHRRGQYLRQLPGGHVLKTGAQDDQRAKKRHADRGNPAEMEFLAKENRSADSDEYRRDITECGDLRDGNARHGEKPERDGDAMHQSAKNVKAQCSRRGKIGENPSHDRQKKDHPENVADKRRLHRRDIGTDITNDSGDRDETECRQHHPADAGDDGIARLVAGKRVHRRAPRLEIAKTAEMKVRTGSEGISETADIKPHAIMRKIGQTGP